LEEADRQQQHAATTLAAKQRQAAPRSEDAAAMQAEFAVIETKRNKIPTWPRVQAVAATAPAYVDTEEQARIQQARVSLRARLANKEISGGQFAAYIMMVKQGKPEPPVRAVVPAMAAAEDGTQSQGDGDDEGAAAHTLLVAEAASPSRAKQGARWRTALGDAGGGWGNWHGPYSKEETARGDAWTAARPPGYYDDVQGGGWKQPGAAAAAGPSAAPEQPHRLDRAAAAAAAAPSAEIPSELSSLTKAQLIAKLLVISQLFGGK
jgi:hypothetical protein